MRLLITGASGFVGRELYARLRAAGHEVVPAVRRSCGMIEERVVGDIDINTQWAGELRGCDAVVHLAARVHVLQETAPDPWPEFYRTNVAATLTLARQAAAAGVRRFVFMSSVKVNGEATLAHRPYDEMDPPSPVDAYGRSKMEAEIGLRDIARETAMQCVIIRSPLVYGPGVRANFHAMLRAVERGVPLPLANVNNRRSLVGIGNLIDFIQTCLQHPAAADETFFISDGDDVSTPELLRHVGAAIGRPPRLFGVPLVALRVGAVMLGRLGVYQRLCGNLQVDITKARTMLGWEAPNTLAQELSAWLAPHRQP